MGGWYYLKCQPPMLYTLPFPAASLAKRNLWLYMGQVCNLLSAEQKSVS